MTYPSPSEESSGEEEEISPYPYPGIMIVTAESGGFEGNNMAKIVINNVPVQIQSNENEHFRGLHFVLINP